MDTTQYLDIFIDESIEHLEVVSIQLLELEKTPNEKTIIEEIFRAAHTLKGMSATMGYNDLANLTHQMENVFDGIRYDKIQVGPEMIDILFDAVDDLNIMVQDIAAGGNGQRDVQDIVNYLKAIEEDKVSHKLSGEQENKKESSEKQIISELGQLDEFERSLLNESIEQGFFNYEIKVTLSENCLLKGVRVFMIFDVFEKHGEIIKSNPSVNDLEEENFNSSFTTLFISKERSEDIQTKIKNISEVETVEISSFFISEFVEEQVENTESSKEQNEVKTVQSKTIRVNIERLDILMHLFEELLIDRGRLEQISTDLKHNDLQETVERMARVSGDLQNIILTMRMVPVDQVFSRFPRMIRQLARDLQKNVEIEIVGAETELDRTVIDEIGDPLVHLIRNSIDHGIEMPEERKQKNKPKNGIIKLEAYHSGNHIFIEITDDGAGINKERVIKKAIENNIVTQEQSVLLTEPQVFDLIMSSGFSTTDEISDVSGRGVGLDVVKNTIESLGGSISIHSERDKGSIFSIQLPLTLSIITALLVEIGKEKYAIPLSSIIETAIISKKQIYHAHGKKVIDLEGRLSR